MSRSRRQAPVPHRSPAEWCCLHRRTLVALLVFVAVLAVLRALAPDGGAAVLVAAPRQDLPVGHVITAEDLTTVRLAGPAARDPGLAGDAVGRTLAVAWPAGVPLHRLALTGSELTKGLAPGTVAVGLPLGADSPVGFLRSGDLVDVVVTLQDDAGRAQATTVATGARVLWVGGDGAVTGTWPGGGSRDEHPAIVVAVPRSHAPEVSSAPLRGAVSLVVSG